MSGGVIVSAADSARSQRVSVSRTPRTDPAWVTPRRAVPPLALANALNTSASTGSALLSEAKATSVLCPITSSSLTSETSKPFCSLFPVEAKPLEAK